MKKVFFAAVLLLFLAVSAFSETSVVSDSLPREGMYTIPQTIYVGDHGRLVLPLGAVYAEIDSLSISETRLLPQSAGIVINRAEIDTKTEVPRLLVDFHAYAPGVLELPLLNIGGYEFSGLTVTIASILEAEGDRVLSEAAPPMNVPGTLALVYGSIIGIVLCLLIVLVFYFKGIPRLKTMGILRRRRHTLRLLKKSLNMTRASVAKNSVSCNNALFNVSQSFRKFLSFFTEMNCFTMVPKEFLLLPKMIRRSGLKGGEIYIVEHAEIIYRIFKRCDELRFNGDVVKKENVLKVLDTMNRFAADFESYEKDPSCFENPLPRAEEASS